MHRNSPRFGLLSVSSLVSVALVMLATSVEAQVRNRATFSLSANGTAPGDAATAGKTADTVTMASGVQQIPSPFTGDGTGRAFLLDDAARQQVSIASSEDIGSGNAITISGLFAVLHAADDATIHGLFAKRQPAGSNLTNYGINFSEKNNLFQVYVNAGQGYRIAFYNVAEAIGSRRRVHLAVSFESADAPGTDADSDVDDVRIRLFVNGSPLKPLPNTQGQVVDTTAWLHDVSLPASVSDTPLTIGGSFSEAESCHLLFDQLHVFTEALSDQDAASLFQEIAGSAADAIKAEQSGGASAEDLTPVLASIRPHAVQSGQSARVTVTGSRLQNAMLHVGTPGVTVTAVDVTKPNEATFEVAVAADAAPGRYLARIVTDRGISNAMVFVTDQLTQVLDGQFTEQQPAQSLPVAVSGVIGAAETRRIWFQARAGQLLSAEVEARRVGSGLDPVVEIKTAGGSPLAIEWRRPDLDGDTRATFTVPADGVYVAEVHDLQYRAPGNSVWRLLVGELPPSGLAFPLAAGTAESEVRLVDAVSGSDPLKVAVAQSGVTIQAGQVLLPLPHLRTQRGTLVSEPFDGTYATDPVDATFTAPPFAPLTICGRITMPGETDEILLKVTAGQALYFAAAAHTIGSPLRPELAVFAGSNRLGFSNGDAGTTDAAVSVTVPEGTSELRVRISDFTGRGSAGAVYQLSVSRSDRPDFVLQADRSSVSVPGNGSAPIRLSVRRQSPGFRFHGPIQLTVLGGGLSVIPQLIPASDTDQQLWITLTRNTASTDRALAIQPVEIVGTAGQGDAQIESRLQLTVNGVDAAQLTLEPRTLLTSATTDVPALLMLNGVPPVLLRGIPTTIPLKLVPLQAVNAPLVRLGLETTEAPRKSNPQDANSPNLPLVAADDFQIAPAMQSDHLLRITVPADVVENRIDAVAWAEFIAQPLAAPGQQRIWSAPLTLTVDHATRLQANAATGKKSSTVELIGTLTRHPAFDGAVSVRLDGLPAGYSASSQPVTGDQTTWIISVTLPAEATVGVVPNLTVTAISAAGVAISPAIPASLTVSE
ncbi:MAG: hypothetical protein KDA85_12145 [Planctomycetaceae bacterium]|nr:hypothetical protein [Planctomycetaceae bacterium]